MKEIYTIISFGNYETKILISHFINGRIYPVYKTSFLSKNCYNKSKIIDEETLLKIFKDELKKIPINIEKTNVIFNLPIKKLIIKDYKSLSFKINSVLTRQMWNEIFYLTNKENVNEEKVLLDAKCYKIFYNNNWSKNIPYGKTIEKMNFESKQYFIKQNDLSCYEKIANKLDLKVKAYLCDSLVMNKLFGHKNKPFKLLINVGHLESMFELYENSILLSQDSILFGIKNLTSVICKNVNIDESIAVDLLNIYRDLANIDEEIPLVNHFKEKFLNYSQTKIKDISEMINKWILNLVSHIENQVHDYLNNGIVIDDIYIYSSSTFFKTWMNNIKDLLSFSANIICLESNFIGISESKYISLIATAIHFKMGNNNFTFMQ